MKIEFFAMIVLTFSIIDILAKDVCDDIDYMILDDSTRNVKWDGFNGYCDSLFTYHTSPDWKGPGWYRLQGDAGTQIPEEDIDSNHCGTAANGHLDEDPTAHVTV